LGELSTSLGFTSESTQSTQYDHLEEAIISLEAQRSLLGDRVVDTAVAPLRERLASFHQRQELAAQQRKFVTVLFVDITNSTSLSQQLELEDMMSFMDGALRRFKAIIEHRGGRVIKFMGDGLMAVFGIPIVQEDDAKRAVRAGLDLISEAKDYRQQIEQQWGLATFDVRVGVDSGPVILGGGVEAERSAIGMTVNLAARMETSAPVGGLRITEATYKQVQGIFDVEAQPPLIVKGREEPVRTYLVNGARPRSFRMGRYGIEGIKTPLVGRKSEFQQLTSAFEVVQSRAKSQLVTILGEPGVGKSRLLVEFEAWLTDQSSVAHRFHGRGFRPLQGSPFHLLRMLFADYCLIQDSDPLELVHHKLETTLSKHIEDDPMPKIHIIGALLGYDFTGSPYLKGVHDDAGQLHQQALHYLTRFFQKILVDGPAVILLEDAHWADDPSLDFLKRISGVLADQPLLFTCVARPELIYRRPNWHEPTGQSPPAHRMMTLAPLSRRHSIELIGNILKSVAFLPKSLVETIAEQAGGNPLFIEELIKVLMEDGVITRTPDQTDWLMSQKMLDEMRVPPTLAAVMQSRLDKLPAAEKTVLQLASVVGLNFWEGALEALDRELDSVRPHLESLIGRELIFRRESTTFAGKTEYSFKHVLLRDATYQTVLKQDRLKYHAQTAAWLMNMCAQNDREDELSPVIARHYELAGRFAAAAGWYERAGVTATAQGAPLEAVRFLDRCFTLLPPESEEQQLAILFAKERALYYLGDTQAQLNLLQSLIDLVSEIGNDTQLAEAHNLHGFCLGSLGRLDQEVQAYEESLIAARRAGNLSIVAVDLSLLARSLIRLGQQERALEAAEEGLGVIEELGDNLHRARALTNLVSFYSETGAIARAAQLSGRTAAACSRLGLPYGEAVNLSNLGYNMILLGMPELALAPLNQAKQIAGAIGSRPHHAYCLLNIGLARLRMEKETDAHEALEEALYEMASIGDRFGAASGNYYLGLANEKTLDLHAAIDRFQRAGSIFEDIGILGNAVDATAGLARCWLALEDPEAARKQASAVWEYLSENGSRGLEFSALAYISCVEVFEALVETERAQTARRAGYDDLMEKASKITDQDWLQSFLNNIPEHQAIIQAKQSEI